MGGSGKTVAARGLVNGRGPLRRSGRDLVFPLPPSEYIFRLYPSRSSKTFGFFVLSNGSLKTDLQELLGLDSELHREL